MKAGMGTLGVRIDKTGTLIRKGEDGLLRRDLGGRYRLELRCKVDAGANQRVRIVGVLVGSDLVDVIDITPQ